MGLGFGVAIGGGFVYALFTDATTRYVTIGITLFILGVIITGTLLVVNNFFTLRAMSPRQEKTAYHFAAPRTLPPPYSGPGWEVLPGAHPPALGGSWTLLPGSPVSGELTGAPPQRYLPGSGDGYDEGDEVVA
jgi:hypothetical protein